MNKLALFDKENYLYPESVVGIDEAGRGAGFGPLVVSAVSLKNLNFSDEINDSKKLSKNKREILSEKIIENSFKVLIKVVSVNEINKYGIVEAERRAIKSMKDELKNFKSIVIDGNINFLSELDNSKCLVKGDTISFSVACASILAKVNRDNLVLRLSKKYPNYNLEKNKGYPTLEHKNLVEKFGLTKEHRVNWGWNI